MVEFLILADIGGMIGLAFFVIAFIGWILNLVNQSSEAQQRQARMQRRQQQGRRESVQDEIDDFLNKNRQKDRSPPELRTQQQQRRETQVRSDEIEVVERRSPPRRKPPERQKKSRKEIWEEQVGKRPETGRQPSQRPQATPQPKPPIGVSRERAPLSSLAQTVEKDLPHLVDSHVASHLGEFRADDADTIGGMGIGETRSHRSTAAEQIFALLRTQTGVRQAIILGEILDRPKTFR
ncbi:MAG: hypothetical protein KDA80_07900 [Planctomycetaceae bacterium]|nr:hypothetical protein [Planctomycetaceae bacterium]